MRKAILLTVFLLSFGLTASCSAPAQERGDSKDRLSEEIIALERSALDRWITGDPQGYLDLYAPQAQGKSGDAVVQAAMPTLTEKFRSA